MYKKISGVDETSVRARQRDAKADMDAYMDHLRAKKDEYRALKADNELEREEMRRQEKMAASFKFTKMAKKTPFFPTLDTRGMLQTEYVKDIQNKLPYIEGRTKEALMFPDKVKDNTKLFGLQKTCDGSYFTQPVGQETDLYDEVLLKYMRTQERGVPRPKRDLSAGATQSIRIPKETTFLKDTNGVFNTTDQWPTLL